MKKLKALVIDDEKGSIDSLLWELEQFKDEVEVVASTQDPLEGLELLKEPNLDLLFLDIEMPRMNGFELIEKAGHVEANIVFTTAYDQFAIKAFEISAMDYLLKPVDENELKRVIEKAKHKEDEQQMQRRLELLLQSVKKEDPAFHTIALPTQESLEFIEVEQIIRCESDSNYTRLFLLNEVKPLLVSKTLKHIESMVEGMGFFRIHHSHLVNVKYIKKYVRGNTGTLVLKDGTALPVSRAKKGDFLSNF